MGENNSKLKNWQRISLQYIQAAHVTQNQISCIPCSQRWRISMLLLLLLSRFSRVQLCATPETAAHQAPRSLGFSRQEHWSGLPFPSPMHESEKWKRGCSAVSDLATPWTAAYQAPTSMGFSRQEYWSGLPFPPPGDLPDPGIKLSSPAWQADCLPLSHLGSLS